MNQELVLTFLLFIGLAFVNSQTCPRNEVPVNCINQCNTCELQGNCWDDCVPGCDCKQGYYRTKFGQCVRRSLCIFDGEDFNAESASLSPIPEEDFDVKSASLSPIPEEDDKVDYDHNQDPSFCPPNEVFVECLARCEYDCKNINQDRIVCSRNFCVSGCRCKKGFVRGPKGTCIKPKKCPVKDGTKYPVKRVCPLNETWSTSLAHCQENCTNLGHPPPCLKIAIPGCICKKGLYRGKNGKCIPKCQCPKKAEEEFGVKSSSLSPIPEEFGVKSASLSPIPEEYE